MILFNCGLSSAELYANVPQQIITHDFYWFKERIDARQDTIEGYMGFIFSCAFRIILETIVEKKVRFVSSYYNSYIDFVTVDEEKFMRDRQNGRFQDIDFIESDFKGYQLMYHWRGSFKDVSRYKKMMIYMNTDVKQPFIDKINTGEVFYSTKDIKTKHIVPELKKFFPKISKEILQRVVEYGFTRMFHAIKQQCTVNIASTTFGIYSYIGKAHFVRERWIREYYFRMRMKLIKLSKWNKEKPTQYYYIALTDERMIHWARLNDKQNNAGWCWVWFNRCYARRILKTALCNSTKSHIFKIKVRKKDMRFWHFYIDLKKYRDVEYLGESINYELTRSSKHWKELVPEYKDRQTRYEIENNITYEKGNS